MERHKRNPLFSCKNWLLHFDCCRLGELNGNWVADIRCCLLFEWIRMREEWRQWQEAWNSRWSYKLSERQSSILSQSGSSKDPVNEDFERINGQTWPDFLRNRSNDFRSCRDQNRIFKSARWLWHSLVVSLLTNGFSATKSVESFATI